MLIKIRSPRIYRMNEGRRLIHRPRRVRLVSFHCQTRWVNRWATSGSEALWFHPLQVSAVRGQLIDLLADALIEDYRAYPSLPR